MWGWLCSIITHTSLMTLVGMVMYQVGHMAGCIDGYKRRNREVELERLNSKKQQ